MNSLANEIILSLMLAGVVGSDDAVNAPDALDEPILVTNTQEGK